jgi:myosin heavy subunit
MSNVSPPIRRKSAKTHAKEKRAGILNSRTPNEMQRFSSEIRSLLMGKLYRNQFQHWHKELQQLIHDNADSMGRQHKHNYAVYWQGKRYKPTLAHSEARAYCMEINPCIEEYAERMTEIAEEIDALEEERYESERFILNLFTFDAPAQAFEKVFGVMLFDTIRSRVERFCNISMDNWHPNSAHEFRVYAEANLPTIKAMQERQMLNLVT